MDEEPNFFMIQDKLEHISDLVDQAKDTCTRLLIAGERNSVNPHRKELVLALIDEIKELVNDIN